MTEQKIRNIGLDVPSPKKTCEDPNCPFHGTLVVKNRTIVGKVVSTKMHNSAVIQREFTRYVPKYERYIKKTTRMSVHNPPCLNVKEGDVVKVALTRPLSKTKNNVIVQILE